MGQDQDKEAFEVLKAYAEGLDTDRSGSLSSKEMLAAAAADLIASQLEDPDSTPITPDNIFANTDGMAYAARLTLPGGAEDVTLEQAEGTARMVNAKVQEQRGQKR